MTSEIFPNPIDISISERRSKLDTMITVLKAVQEGMNKPHG